MKKSYYDKKTGEYIDITTGKKYRPHGVCELCGSRYLIDFHHYIEQQRCLRDLNAKRIKYPKTLNQDEINKLQKVFEVCRSCHTDIHNLSDNRFLEKYGIERTKFIYKN